MSIDIINARQVPLNDEEIRCVVDIEFHPKTREWLTEYLGNNVEKAFEAYRSFFRNLPHNKRTEILVAKNEGQVVGFLGLWNLGRYMEHVATIGVSVHPDHWGKGIATQLVSRAIDLAKEKDFKRLEIETLAENSAMRRIAEKLGFKLEGLRKNRIQKEGKYHDEAAYSLLI